MKVVELSEKLEDVVAKYNLSDSASVYKNEFAIAKTQDLKKALEEMEQEGRILKIGIVGRVKAGKSSLLNALIFDGDSILPSAATPMTAALTVMEYSPDTKAEVEFFTQEDLSDIKHEHDEYLRQLENLIEEKFKQLKEKNKKNKPDEELQETARKQATREMKGNDKLFSSYDQYCRIKDSDASLEELKEFEEITAENTQELNKKLLDFVGADGKYMPFTKSVTLKLNEENLKDVQIIDTPGVNDPVTSREDRTRELLKYCDVILIVSPSGQFLSSEDMDLFDRITTKEGIKELYIIASQIDNQLYGSEKKAGGGILHKVLQNTTKNLTNHMHSVLSKDEYLKDNPTFKSLLSNEVVYSSGICYSLMQSLDKKEQWDKNKEHVWGLLTEQYKDYFSDDTIARENLKLLANMQKINDILNGVKDEKENILKEKKDSFEKAKEKGLKNYQNALIKEINRTIEKLKNSDIEEIKKKIEHMSKIKSKSVEVVDEAYSDKIDTLEYDIKSSLLDKLNSYFRDSKRDISNSEGSETESYTVDKGWFQGVKSLFGGDDRYETRHRTYTTVKAGHIRNSLDELTDKLEMTIDIEAKRTIEEWKKELVKNIVHTLRDVAGDSNLEIDLLSKTIKQIVNSVTYPEVNYGGGLPSSLRKSGTLEGSSAERFIDDARDYVDNLKGQVKSDINSYIKNLVQKLKETNIADSIFKKYESDMKKFEDDINNKTMMLEKYNMIVSELEKL
ncbi:dynamin family protein [Sulfurimonas sp. NW15]|uniref:dynamin family protein n=1 Tax=Sulfurimonas sp. NW15 TaxID=2922729 RepID=UPI003DA8BD7B